MADRPAVARLASKPSYRWLVVGTVCIGAFLGQLDASIATLVLPTLEQVFGAPTAAVEWVAIAYLLTLATLVVTFGRLADMTGRKLMYTAGFIVFIGGSALCGFAPSLGWLIGFRVLQAVGAGMLQANSVAIITAAVPRRELGRAIGLQGAAQAVGLSVGPSVGGVLIATLNWQWVFFIAVPFGLTGTVLAWFILPSGELPPDQPRPLAQERFDWAGAFTFAGSVGLALVALTFGSSWGWGSPRLLGVVIASLLVFSLFAFVERRTAHPLVDFALFRNSIFSAGIASGLLSYAVLFGTLFLLPFYLQRGLHQPPATAGALLTAVPVALATVAPLSGLLADGRGARLPAMCGMAVTTVSLLLLTRPEVGGSTSLLLGVFALLGAGLGLFTPANNSAIMGAAPRSRLGVAGGLLNMTRSLGTSLGVAATGLVLELSTSASGGRYVASTLQLSSGQLLAGVTHCLVFLAGLSVMAAVVSGIRRERRLAADHSAAAEALAESVGV
jgi:EmrB/QacA subfamily drug resistance transporter